MTELFFFIPLIFLIWLLLCFCTKLSHISLIFIILKLLHLYGFRENNTKFFKSKKIDINCKICCQIILNSYVFLSLYFCIIYNYFAICESSNDWGMSAFKYCHYILHIKTLGKYINLTLNYELYCIFLCFILGQIMTMNSKFEKFGNVVSITFFAFKNCS